MVPQRQKRRQKWRLGQPTKCIAKNWEWAFLRHLTVPRHKHNLCVMCVLVLFSKSGHGRLLDELDCKSPYYERMDFDFSPKPQWLLTTAATLAWNTNTRKSDFFSGKLDSLEEYSHGRGHSLLNLCVCEYLWCLLGFVLDFDHFGDGGQCIHICDWLQYCYFPIFSKWFACDGARHSFVTVQPVGLPG